MMLKTLLFLIFLCSKGLTEQEHCNVTMCDYQEKINSEDIGEILGKEIKSTQLKLLKLERRLRSLEQPGNIFLQKLFY